MEVPEDPFSLRRLQQQAPVILAPETNFMEDNFSTNQGWEGMVWGMIQMYYIYCTAFISCHTVWHSISNFMLPLI